MTPGLGKIAGSCRPVLYLEVVHICNNEVYKWFAAVMQARKWCEIFPCIHFDVCHIFSKSLNNKDLKSYIRFFFSLIVCRLFFWFLLFVELTSEPPGGVTVWQVLWLGVVVGLLMLDYICLFHNVCCNSFSTNTVMLKCTLLILCHFNRKAL